MSKLSEEIKQGLKEAIADAKDHNLKRNHIYIEPVKKYTSKEVKKIRTRTGLTQKLFASFLGVSSKTIEAWEEGVNTPSGAASRMLTIIENDNKALEKYPFVVA